MFPTWGIVSGICGCLVMMALLWFATYDLFWTIIAGLSGLIAIGLVGHAYFDIQTTTDKKGGGK